jgi:hypothetical protein
LVNFIADKIAAKDLAEKILYWFFSFPPLYLLKLVLFVEIPRRIKE